MQRPVMVYLNGHAKIVVPAYRTMRDAMLGWIAVMEVMNKTVVSHSVKME